ncbi:MAG: cell envelope integrity protein CreD [Maritimibacter sp.]
MRRSLGMRFLIVAVLTLLMGIPLLMASGVIQDRKNYSRNTLTTVGAEWGGKQVVTGPILIVPVQKTEILSVKQDVIDDTTGVVKLDDKGFPIQRIVEVSNTTSRDPVYLMPGTFDVEVNSKTQTRHRGIFNVPVYTAGIDMDFDFPTELIEASLKEGEEARWAGATLVLYVSSNAALRGETILTQGDKPLAIEPLASSDNSGITALLGDPRNGGSYHLDIGLNGAQSFEIAPVGRTTKVNMTSDWPHPSFQGGFLPDSSEISEEGFSAVWTIPHVARTLPQISRENYRSTAARASFGYRLFQPNDFYQKAHRATAYGILFIALTFLTVLLVDRVNDKPAHPVQYILIGLAQSTFVLLMVSYAEQFGFLIAYLIASGAVTILITLFALVGLKLGARAWVLGAMLIVLYAVLYLILESTDYALLAGSTLAFVAIAATMWFTRNEEWYGPEGAGLFARKSKVAPPPAPPKP